MFSFTNWCIDKLKKKILDETTSKVEHINCIGMAGKVVVFTNLKKRDVYLVWLCKKDTVRWLARSFAKEYSRQDVISLFDQDIILKVTV